MDLSSTTIRQGENIPQQHTCDGPDRSPPLEWMGVPDRVTTFAVICEDPDAPGGTFDHWVIFNIPGEMRQLQAGIAPVDTLPNGARQGKNSGGTNGYRGPCPPRGAPHRYIFRLYALDTRLELSPGSAKAQVLAAMQGHIMGQAELMGRYGRA